MFTKITDSDLTNKGVVGLPDTPNLSTTEMQEKFDEIANDVIIPKFNNLVDEMADSSAAENIGAVDIFGIPTTVQELILETKNNSYTKVQADTKFVEKEEGKTLTSNDFTDEDKEKLDSLENYELPIGTVETLGGVKPDNETFTIDENGVGHAIGGGGTGTADYNALINKPQINGVTLIGNVNSSELGLKFVHIKVTYEADVVGGTITCKNGDEVETYVADDTLTHTFDLSSLGTWVISEDATDTSETLEVNMYGNYETSLGGKVKIVVNYGSDMVGKNITVTHDGVTKTKVASGTNVRFSFKPHGEFTVGEDLNNQTEVVNATTDGTYTVNFKASINVTISDLLIGNVFTCNDGTTTYTWLSDSSEHTFVVSKFGTWVVTNADTGATVEVVVSNYAEYSANFGTMSWQGWLESASIPTSSFTDLESVLASETTVRTLMNKHASVDYLAEWIVSDESTGRTILNNDLCAKWINLRDYALDTLYSNSTVKSIMDEVDKYGYGEWVEKDGTWQPKGNVPIMTSNNAPYGVASASKTQSGYGEYNAFNQDNSKYWLCSIGSSESNVWLQYEFTNPICAKKMSFVLASAPVITNVLLSVIASNDGFVNDINVIGNATESQGELKLNNNKYYKQYRLHIESLTLSQGSGIGVVSLQFYGRELKVSVPTMTSNTEPWGEVFSSTSSTVHVAWHAFDSDSSSTWASTESTLGQYIGYTFTNPIKVNSVKLVSTQLSGGDAIKTFKVQGSNDNSTWEDITDVLTTRGSTTGTESVFYFSNDKCYKKYRIYILSNYGFSGKITCGQLQFYGLDYSEHDERHYIYDHGVEVEELATSGISTKNSNSIVVTSQSYSSSRIGNKNAIDLSSYKLARAKVINSSNVGYGYIVVTKDINGTPTSFSVMSGLPNNVYMDFGDSLKESFHVTIQSNPNGSVMVTQEFSALWLE